MAVATAKREKPIRFRAHEVPSVMSGAKTQTRRVIGLGTLRRSDTPGYDWTWRGQAPVRSIARQKRRPRGCWQDVTHEKFLSLLPYQVGDLLYVRETMRVYGRDSSAGWEGGIEYRADHDSRGFTTRREAEAAHQMWLKQRDRRWTPSIHCPRWAARTWLEVVGVKVERLQDISEEDAIAEGCLPDLRQDQYDNGEWARSLSEVPARQVFAELWDSLAKPGSQWADNPYVSVTEFRKVER